MDPRKAQDDLDQANRSATYRPPLPRWVPPVCGLLTATSITIAGLAPTNVWWHLATVAAGTAIAVLAGLLILLARSRQGIRGVRGPNRRKWITIGISGVAFLICALAADPQTRWRFAGLGVAAGIAMGLALWRERSCSTA